MITTVGGVDCWGSNGSGQLGNGTMTDSSLPMGVLGLAGEIKAIAAGWNHTCAVTIDGDVSCWGSNGSGQLGSGTTTDSLIPIHVTGLGPEIHAIAAGANHTCALGSGGGVMCWGDNYYGQLGTDDRPGSPIPVDVSGLTSEVRALGVGGGRTCAIMDGGGMQCWGSNGTGGLGNGATTNSSVPVDVSGLVTPVGAVAVGRDHTCALTTGGAVQCWGSNSYGQLGIGATTNSSVPIDVYGLASRVIAIQATAFHTCAIDTSDDLQCWGLNRHGQLGEETTN